jgi:hypothetical protein
MNGQRKYDKSRCDGVLLRQKEEQNYFLCRKMGKTDCHHVNQNKPDSGR